LNKKAVEWEEGRLSGIARIEDYPWFKERHRVFPAAFEDRKHRHVLDLSAGVGCAARRIRDAYPCEILCNDVSPTCLRLLESQGLPTVSFDLDDGGTPYPFEGGRFDALISLVTIEHLLDIDHFFKEARRILADDGRLYLSTPNYAAPEYAFRLLFKGKTFHDPLSSLESRYEFYTHLRYFTYRTLLELARSFGFAPEAAYLALPGGSSRYKALLAASKAKALAFRTAMGMRHRLLPVRWASEPIVCFRKSDGGRARRKVRKVVL
jgi:SAM-dependent methyltransferase